MMMMMMMMVMMMMMMMMMLMVSTIMTKLHDKMLVLLKFVDDTDDGAVDNDFDC